MQNTLEHNDVAERVRALAVKHRVSYETGARDHLARRITLLAGDDVSFDETELLLVALQRAGVLDRKQTVLMQAEYLRQPRP